VSKARLVITAVVVLGRSLREVARAYGVSHGWISRLVARFRLEGEAAFEPRSRRPHRSPPHPRHLEVVPAHRQATRSAIPKTSLKCGFGVMPMS